MSVLKKINLDVARVIAAIMVVAIHTYPFELISPAFDYMITRVLFRVAVPLFLMITGYFLLPKAIDDIDVLKKYTIKVLMLYGISVLIYLPINIYNGYFSNINFITLIKDLFVNGTFYHLWYFPALILGIWITYILVKNVNSNKVFLIFLLLYIVGIFGDNYYGLVSNIGFIKVTYKFIFSVFDYTRNGLFYSPIFLYLGYRFHDRKNEMSFRKNLIYIVVFLTVLLTEGMGVYYFNISRHSSMYFSLIPVSILIFNLLISNKGSSKNIRSLATWIYILHPLFIIVVRLISKITKFNILVQNNFIQYLVVLFLTIVFIKVCGWIRGVINDRGFIKE